MKFKNIIYATLFLLLAVLLQNPILDFGKNNLDEGKGAAIEFENYILNGIPVQDSDVYNYHVVGVYNSTSGRNCTGVILHERIVITAAHCVFDRANDQAIYVRAGTNIKDPQRYTSFQAKWVYHHRKFELLPEHINTKDLPRYLKNIDLAIIGLKESLPNQFKEVAVFDGSLHDLDLARRPQLLIAGFGLAQFKDDSSFGSLRYGNDILVVQWRPSDVQVNLISENYAGLSGDSGGPFYYQNQQGQLFLAGILSWRYKWSEDTDRINFYVNHMEIYYFLNEVKDKFAKTLRADGITF